MLPLGTMRATLVVVNLLADLVSPLLDPRVRLTGGRRREVSA